MPDRIEVEGTDLEVVAYVNGMGNLVIRVNKLGVCIADVGLRNVTDELSYIQLSNIGALTRPVLRDLRQPHIVDILSEHNMDVQNTDLPAERQ
jgi:hypothetical protein